MVYPRFTAETAVDIELNVDTHDDSPGYASEFDEVSPEVESWAMQTSNDIVLDISG